MDAPPHPAAANARVRAPTPAADRRSNHGRLDSEHTRAPGRQGVSLKNETAQGATPAGRAGGPSRVPLKKRKSPGGHLAQKLMASKGLRNPRGPAEAAAEASVRVGRLFGLHLTTADGHVAPTG
jgi:hypothetical protein